MTTNLPFRSIFLVLIGISLFSLSGFSQKKSNYSLLWKISGNGLTKPSYLFGTMHVKDKKVFNFSDSVLLCLQSCQRFALEVHPDTIMKKMFALMQSNDTSRSMEKLLNKDDYEKLAKKFKEKNGYPMGKADPVAIESLMEPDDAKPDDEASFIDAYLYGMARTLNKSIFGLENAASQVDEYYGSTDAVKERILDLLDDGNQEYRAEGKNSMVKIYSTGDLDAIYKYAEENNMLDSTITARNKVMANSMIRFMADSALFTAVGAAHLPGPNGLIALLRKAGYQVTRVQAGFTGVAGKYHVDYIKMNWPVYHAEDFGYSVSFPGTPVKNNMYGTNNIIYPDLANGTYLGVSLSPKGTPDDPAKWSDVISKVIKNLNLNKKNVILSKKDLVFKGLPCTEFLISNSSGYIRTRFLLANNMLYSVYAGSKANHLSKPYTDKFFNSFVNYPIPPKSAKPWITYTNDAGAFSIRLPVQPTPVIKEVPAKIQTKQVTFKINMYVSTDSLNYKSYLVRYNDYPQGTFLGDRETLFNSLIGEFKNKAKIVAGPVKIMKDEFEGREIKVILNGGYSAVIRIYVRGNRMYLLLKEIIQADLKDNNVADEFFDSFQLKPYIQPAYYTYQADSDRFKVQMVSKPTILRDSSRDYDSYISNTATCYSTDPNSGGVYSFEYSKISPYYQVTSTDSLYKKLITGLVGYKDSLLKLDTVSISGRQGRELITITKKNGVQKRCRILIDNDDIFYLTGKNVNSALFDKTNNAFYNSFTLTRAASTKVDLTSSKAEKICNDLGSTDSVTYKSSLGALSFYKFTTAELPYIYKALKRTYNDDSLSTGARCSLVDKLHIVNTDSTINILSDLYQNSSGMDELKSVILQTIPEINKQKGYDIYWKLFTSGPTLKLKETGDIFNPLSDSVEFAAVHLEQLLPYIKYDDYRNYILRTANRIATKKSTAYSKKLKDNFKLMMAFAYTDMDKYMLLKDSDDNKWSGCMYNYLQLMSKINEGDFNDKFTGQYIQRDPKGSYLSDAVIARISNGLPTNARLINKFMDSLGTRYDIMEAFTNYGQQYKIPLEYRKQDAFAKLCLYQEISSDDDDYGSPTKMSLLGSIIKNGAVFYVFKYLQPDREDDKELIGIAGPYTPGSPKLNFDKYYAYTDYDVVKLNWRQQAEKMIKPLLDQYK